MSLYLAHFGLREPPFRITPHTDFFFSGANRGPTLDALIYAITQDEGIVKVTGEVGSGKTMLCRMLLEKLPAHVETVYLANPSLSRQEILGAIADELGVPLGGQSTHSMTRALQDALVDRYAAGKRVVVLIDEAHAMPAESLEEIRLLSNLESKSNKLLQIALFAQPELEDRLAATDMRQLRERITQHFSLAPLKPGDVAAYIEFRLRAAGYRGPNPFTEKAVDLVASTSQGLSRRINILADKALLAAYSAGSHRVDVAEAKTAAQDARFTPLATAPDQSPWNRLAWAALGAALAALVSGALWWANQKGASLPPAAAGAAAAAHETPAPAPPTVTAKPAAPPLPAAAAAPLGPLAQKYQTSFAAWLPTADHRHYFLQLMATDGGNVGEVENFLARFTGSLDGEQLRVYRSNLSGRERLGIIYGDYPSRSAARAATAGLPEELRQLQPYPRQVSRLH